MMKYIKMVLNMEIPDLIIFHNLIGFLISMCDEIKKYFKIFQILYDIHYQTLFR